MNILFFQVLPVYAGLLALYMYVKLKVNNAMPFSEFAKEYVAKNLVTKMYVGSEKAVALIDAAKSFQRLPQDGPESKDDTYDPEEITDSFDTFESQSSERTTAFKRKAVVVDLKGYNNALKKMTELQTELGVPADEHIDVFAPTKPMHSFVPNLLILAAFALAFLSRKRVWNMVSPTKSSITRILAGGGEFAVPRKPKTRLADVAGLKNAKLEMAEFIDFLRNKKRYRRLGARIPKGALLVGPPGTGKTLIAKAVAGEADCPFFATSGAEFVQIFGGMGAKRVRELFARARRSAPAIVFIDEFDAVARKRSMRDVSSSNSERDSTLNQLLVEMDGFGGESGVVVFAATNLGDSLDSAVTRAGRFDRQITVDLPDLEEREEIFGIHLAPIKTNGKAALARKMAALTPQFSGADIRNICNEAAIFAGRAKKKKVETADFYSALDRVVGGMERPSLVVSQKQRWHIAVHEAGHAVASWFSEFTEPLLKVTIVPRSGGVMGFAQYLPREVALMRLEEVLASIKTALGGRVAEALFFRHLTTGASNDLERVTQLAYGCVRSFGFCEEAGIASFPALIPSAKPPFSSKTGERIDRSVQRLVADMFEETKQLLSAHKARVEALAETLIERKTVNHDEIIQILGPKPRPNEQYKRYLERMEEKGE